MDSLLALDDAALLGRYLCDGDESAIGVLYLRYAGRLRAYGEHHLRDADAARDLVQDTWEALLTYRGLSETRHFRGLLYRVASRLVATWWQRAKRERGHRGVFVAEGGEILPRGRYAGAQFDLPKRKPDGTCTYCGEKARKGQSLCHAHAMRRARGATEVEMRKPIRRRT